MRNACIINTGTPLITTVKFESIRKMDAYEHAYILKEKRAIGHSIVIDNYLYQNEMTIPGAPCFWPSFSSNLKFSALFKARPLVTIEILM
jgi:peptide methionine sulfoxide reductase MsrB